MAGRMGNKRVIVRNLKVFMIDTKLNLLYLRGTVPGKHNFVRITDALYAVCMFELCTIALFSPISRLCSYRMPKMAQELSIPFPTHFAKPDEKIPDILESPPPQKDPRPALIKAFVPRRALRFGYVHVTKPPVPEYMQ
jgi:hypothetical protein